MNSKANRQLSHLLFSQQHLTFRRMVSILTILGILSCFYLPAYADRLVRTITTTVYFEKHGEPYDKPVDFTIDCFGGMLSHDISTDDIHVPDPEKVFSLSGTCPHYGCEIVAPYVPFHLGIDYCRCEGETEGEEFVSVYFPTSARDIYQPRSGFLVFLELTFDIPTSSEATDSDGNGEPTDSDTDDDNDGGCFITTLLQP